MLPPPARAVDAGWRERDVVVVQLQLRVRLLHEREDAVHLLHVLSVVVAVRRPP